MKASQIWNSGKQPIAATIAALLAAIAAILISGAGWVIIDPGSVAFITMLLIDTNSAENFYVNSTLRIVGTLIGLAVGAAVGFVANELDSVGVDYEGLEAFRLTALAVTLLVPLWIMKEFPLYVTPCVICIFTATSLIFAGTSNAVTIATIAIVVGGVIIAAIVMFMFRYDSTESVLLADHSKLLNSVLDISFIYMRANSEYRSTYFSILDSTKASFSKNVDNVSNYKRWLRWTGRSPPTDFDRLIESIRPLYHQTASLFWSLCRDKVVSHDHTPKAAYLFCSSAEIYFDLYHSKILQLVNSIESIRTKLVQILNIDPTLLFKNSLIPALPHFAQYPNIFTILTDLIDTDLVHGILEHITTMRQQFSTSSAMSHPNASQQWFFCEYVYQVSNWFVDFLDYLKILTETVLSDKEQAQIIFIKIRALTNHAEVVANDGFCQDSQPRSPWSFSEDDAVSVREISPACSP